MRIKNVGTHPYSSSTPYSKECSETPNGETNRISTLCCQAVSHPAATEQSSLEQRRFEPQQSEMPPACQASDDQIMDFLRLPQEDLRGLHDFK